MAYVGADPVAMAKLYQKIGSELIMWYVIQTVNGQEQQVCTWINQRMDQTLFERCFVPLYEDVWRKKGVGHISVRKTFAGYVFIPTVRMKYMKSFGKFQSLRLCCLISWIRTIRKKRPLSL